jgi:type II restriction enzyme
MIALEAGAITGFKFVWFTDGAAWNSARQNLRETFEVLPDLYNIKELEDGIAERLFV